MPYSIDWYIEEEIIYTRYFGVVTADELRQSLLDGRSLIENSPRPHVHTLTDVGDVTQPVSPTESLRVIREVGSHERSGWNIILREQSILIKMGVAFGTSVLKSRNKAFDTLEEADAFLKEYDPTLNWERADRSIVPG